MELKKALLIIALLVVVSPVFGVILADMVGYHEPLDIAAETVGLEDITDQINWTPFLDYTVPGLPDEIGYIVAGFIGVAIVWALGMGLARLASQAEVAES